ncbi:hypothetical protein Pmani_003860 [Petrolisthes manimaculis]|uniref:Superoxide dismutase [Cu-Zn] n=1 Tax=Petrolisthes manimaculis TaxID=1843537 RepID=A0AAE1QEU3_9EUCA|nr:hypothetical protein Pmani_003860 [Petrolisthes manimaculis]
MNEGHLVGNVVSFGNSVRSYTIYTVCWSRWSRQSPSSHLIETRPPHRPVTHTYIHSEVIMAWVTSITTLCLLSLASITSTNKIVPSAVLSFIPGVDNISGNLQFYPTHYGVVISGVISGLSPGKHGFHVHAKGNLGNKCADAAGHFNPFNARHGAPTDRDRHVGDLGNVLANQYGVAYIYIEDRVISLDPNSQAYIGGLAIVVHQGVDDLGRGGNADSLKTGNAGSRSGCGIIEVQQRFRGIGLSAGRRPVYYSSRKC